MAYDEHLAERIRAALPDRDDVTERKMFGGIAWMIAGNMACGIMAGDSLLARVGPDATAAGLEEPHTRAAEMGERTMKGYVVVDPEGIAGDEDLQRWVDEGVEYSLSLPAK